MATGKGYRGRIPSDLVGLVIRFRRVFRQRQQRYPTIAAIRDPVERARLYERLQGVMAETWGRKRSRKP